MSGGGGVAMKCAGIDDNNNLPSPHHHQKRLIRDTGNVIKTSFLVMKSQKRV
jgi:hypothetical protein